ncbi:MAG: cell division protein FtsZ [Verrucomicrobiota bacterium]
MIEINRAPIQLKDYQVRVIGVGGAGCHAVDRLSKEGLAGGDLIVANTDVRALNSCVTPTRIALGQKLTRGLGAGGDPDVGRAAVEESLDAVCESLAGSSLVIVLAGLGGGTGSGSAPRIAEAAREHGAHVVVLTTTPFSFEGKRRGEQAVEALGLLRENSDLVICFENDRMTSLVDATAGVEEAFSSVDALWVQAVRALVSMTKRHGIMNSGLDEISAALSGSYSTALFGHGLADGDDRVNEALRKALSSPLFGVEGEISAASGLWVYVAGGSDLRWAEVQMLMTEVNRQVSPDIRLFFGAGIDPLLNGAVSLTLLAGVPCMGKAEIARFERRRREVAATSVFAKAPTALSVPPPTVLEEHEPVHESEDIQGYRSPGMVADEIEEESEPVFFVESEAVVVDNSAVVEPVDELPQETLLEPPSEELPLPPVAEVPPKQVPKPPFERASELRRDIGAALLKRRVVETHSRSEDTFSEVAEETESSDRLSVPVEGEVAEAPVPAEIVELAQPEDLVEEVAKPREALVALEAQTGQAPASHPRSKPTVQEQMHFEPVNRGRFEKTDPTMIDGQDLDVPTFMRRKVSIGGESTTPNT